MRWPAARRWRAQLLDEYGAPEENPAYWASISANSFLKDLSGPVQIHHGLRRACTDHSRKRPAIKCHHIFRSSRCNNDGIGLIVMHRFSGSHHNLLILIKTDHCRIQYHFNTCLVGFLKQFLPDDKAADLRFMFL